MEHVNVGPNYRAGFSSENGVFRDIIGGMERIEVSKLRDMFLPTQSPECAQALDKNPNLVCSQLKHYGVSYEDDDKFRRGTVVMKKALKEGKCDQVPDHILDLEKRMHREWTRESERVNQHRNYLKTRQHDLLDPSKLTPVGSYLVECPAILDMGDKNTIDIHNTDTPGVWKAEWHFDFWEGVLLIRAERPTTEDHHADLDEDKWSDSEIEYDPFGYEKSPDKADTTAANASTADVAKQDSSDSNGKQPSSPAKAEKKIKTSKYRFRVLSLEANHINCVYQADDKVLAFNGNFTQFGGYMDLTFGGGPVYKSFMAYKVSDVPNSPEYYEEERYNEYLEQFHPL